MTMVVALEERRRLRCPPQQQLQLPLRLRGLRCWSERLKVEGCFTSAAADMTMAAAMRQQRDV